MRLDEHLDGRRVAQEGRRAGRQPVCAGLEHDDEVTDLGPGDRDVVAEQVERGAQAADHGRLLADLVVHPVADGDRVVPPDHLAEVTRRGELVMQPTVDDEEGPPAGLLAIDDPGDVDPGLADDVPAQLDDDPCVGQVRPDGGGEQVGQVGPDGGQVDRGVAVEVRDPEATHRSGQWVSRTGDTISVDVPSFGDAAGHPGYSVYHTAHTALSRNGIEVFRSADLNPAQIPVPATDGRYRLELFADRGDPFPST